MHRWLLVVVVVAAVADRATAETFLDRGGNDAVRVATWNIYFDSVFPDVDVDRSASFSRVAAAVDADVWSFQEMYNHSSAQLKSLLDAARPLGTPGGWQIYKNGEHAIASRYPLTLTRSNTTPAGYRGVAMALVNLPDNRYAADLYVMNAHYKCCGGYDPERQQQTNAFINWMRDARTPGESITLPAGTPMMIMGDFNIVDAATPIDTLLTGDIQGTGYGADSPPDWDGTPMMAAAALHNTVGPDLYTWRSDGSGFAPGRLDYITYTDSVLPLVRSFVLNTATMSPADLAAAGLQPGDSVYNLNNFDYDHLPVVADFRVAAAADANGDGLVDATDLTAWSGGFGLASGAARSVGNFDGDQNVDGADFLTWQRQFGLGGGGQASVVPEPDFAVFAVLALAGAIWNRRSGKRAPSGELPH